MTYKFKIANLHKPSQWTIVSIVANSPDAAYAKLTPICENLEYNEYTIEALEVPEYVQLNG